VKRIELEATEWKRKVTGDADATIVGTFELLEYLRNVYDKEKEIDDEKRDVEYTFVMGRDAYDDLIAGKWIRGDEILKTTNIVVIPRITSKTPTMGTTATSAMIKETKSVVFLENIPGLRDVSSTAIREAIKNGAKPSTIGELNPFVAEYIEENRLYE
jgi:nicotinic acid mononucleotide adenylyltransferase